MEARWARAHDTASCPISVPSTSVEDPDPTRILGKQGSAGKLSVATSKFGSRQIGKLFQPVVEALACEEDLVSYGWGNVRHPSNSHLLRLGHHILVQALAPAPESATSDDRKRRAASGKGSSISAKKMCVDKDICPAPICELDVGIAPMEIVADVSSMRITQSDADSPLKETNERASEVLEVSRLRIARGKPSKMWADAH